MRDINFFEPYLNTEERFSYKKIALYCFTSILVLGLILFPLINFFRINTLKKDIAVMRVELESDDTYDRLAIVEQKKEKLSQMENELLLLKSIDEVINEKDVVNDLLLNKITSKVPKDVFLTYLSILPSQVQIKGVATNTLAIAQLESNLKFSEEFQEIFIPNILLEEGLYHFSITFNIKGGEKNESN